MSISSTHSGGHEEWIRDDGSWIVKILSWNGSNPCWSWHIYFTKKNMQTKLLISLKWKEARALALHLHRKENKLKMTKSMEIQLSIEALSEGFLICASRPYVMYAISYLSRYMSSPRMKHYQEDKMVLRYVKGTSSFGVFFTSVDTQRLIGYSDNDKGSSIEDKKSTTCYAFNLGSAMSCW